MYLKIVEFDKDFVSVLHERKGTQTLFRYHILICLKTCHVCFGHRAVPATSNIGQFAMQLLRNSPRNIEWRFPEPYPIHWAPSSFRVGKTSFRTVRPTTMVMVDGELQVKSIPRRQVLERDEDESEVDCVPCSIHTTVDD